MELKRAGGILLHPTSLPGKYGIGTLGKEAYAFIDFLSGAGQHYWQILPLGPTGYADSPYQCFSCNAGNPLLIDLDLLVQEELLKEKELASMADFRDGPVDYGKVIRLKYPLLRKAADRFHITASAPFKKDYLQFVKKHNDWLEDYALFMALKDHFGQKPWQKWTKGVKMAREASLKPFHKTLKDEMEFQYFIQYLFFRQWSRVKEYAHSKEIKIIGDIPLYVALDSADAWANPGIFQFDKEKNPVAVGGVPPDYFSKTGQLWGNPLFRWDVLKKTGYQWWIGRISNALELYDVIRIDHFRGFAGYWSIPYGEKTAINGKWITGPGKDLFNAIRKHFGELPIIAEDLGVITEDVIALRDSFGLPGMKILQFAFDSSEANDYLPHNFTRNCLVYTGTHDNDTTLGWFEKASKSDRKYVQAYLDSDGKDISRDLIRLAWASVACLAIVPMQDLLGLGTGARMNHPGTVGDNWQWRMRPGDLSGKLEKQLLELTTLYGR